MMNDRITCLESDKLRKGLMPWAACTNYVGGEVLDHERPPHSLMEWCDDDEVVRLIDVLDADGCRHTKEERSGDDE